KLMAATRVVTDNNRNPRKNQIMWANSQPIDAGMFGGRGCTAICCCMVGRNTSWNITFCSTPISVVKPARQTKIHPSTLMKPERGTGMGGGTDIGRALPRKGFSMVDEAETGNGAARAC